MQQEECAAAGGGVCNNRNRQHHAVLQAANSRQISYAAGIDVLSNVLQTLLYQIPDTSTGTGAAGVHVNGTQRHTAACYER